MIQATDDHRRFLAGGGDTARLIAEFDWSATAVGPIEKWPQHLRSLVATVAHSPVAMTLLWGVEGLLIYNDGYAVVSGARHPHILGRSVLDSWPEAAAFNAAVIRRVMSGESLTYQNQEFELHRNGVAEQVWLTLEYSPVFDDRSEIAGAVAIVRETTETVRAHRSLSAERKRFGQMFEQAPSFMAMLSGPRHRIEFINPGFSRLIGHREVVGQTVAEALPDAAAQGYVELLDRVYQSGEAFTAAGRKYTVLAAAGGPVREHYVDFVYQPLTDEEARVTGIFVEGFDVTDQVTSDAGLRASEARREVRTRLTETLRDLDDAILIEYTAARILGETLHVNRVGYGTVTDSDHLHVLRDWTSPAIQSLAGTVPLRDYGSFIDSLRAGEFVHIDDVAADPRTADAAAALHDRQVRAFVNVPLIEHGRLVAVFFVNHASERHWSAEDLAFIREVADRTRTAAERARNEVALREREAQLREANETLEAKVETRTRELMLAEAALRQAQKMEAVGQLTGGIAHDFNNLLAAISGSLELVEARLANGRLNGVERYLSAAQGAARRAAALTQRLLAFSRRQTLDPKPTDVNRLINGMEDLIRRSVGPGVEIEVVGAGGLWATKVDASQLENSLLNLCINARDAMAPDGGRLTIETANKWLDERAAKERDLPAGQYVSLCVTDTGTGMEPEVIARAFDPFFTTKPLGEGTGLGLSMVYGFARQSGGQVRIYSEIGRGTTMCLYLPRIAGPALAADAEPAPAGDKGDGETVLVIDDEPTIRMLIIEVLEENGYASMEAADGAGGLRILQSDTRIDLLITDVGLPGGMNGRQVADAARELRPGLKVLFITGFAENAAVGNGHLGPSMEVMTKPFGMTALGAKIRDLIDR